MLTVLAGMVFFYSVFWIIHNIIVMPIMSQRKLKWFDEMSSKKKMLYSSYYNGIVHAVLSTIGAIFSLLYADGLPGTTYFDSNHY